MLDLKTNQWEQLQIKGYPSARSGHRMVSFFLSLSTCRDLFGAIMCILGSLDKYIDKFSLVW